MERQVKKEGMALGLDIWNALDTVGCTYLHRQMASDEVPEALIKAAVGMASVTQYSY